MWLITYSCSNFLEPWNTPLSMYTIELNASFLIDSSHKILHIIFPLCRWLQAHVYIFSKHLSLQCFHVISPLPSPLQHYESILCTGPWSLTMSKFILYSVESNTPSTATTYNLRKYILIHAHFFQWIKNWYLMYTYCDIHHVKLL